MEYESGKYKFVDTGSHVVVYRNGEKWGVPQGDKFLRVLLQDIQKLGEVIEDRTGDIVHLYEENEKLKEFITGNEYDLTPEFRRDFPKGF